MAAGGGPAFPAAIPLVHDEQQGKDYPSYAESGMELRDYFAAKALAGIIASYSGENIGLPPVDTATERAYAYADAMLKARGR